MFQQLWPENPTYQVYVPGYHPSLSGSRPHSATPSASGGGGGVHHNPILYAELQFPVTSNYGSMKKKSQRDSLHSISGAVSGSERSPVSDTSTLPMSSHSLENVHRYIPEYVSINNKKTAV